MNPKCNLNKTNFDLYITQIIINILIRKFKNIQYTITIIDSIIITINLIK